MDRRSKSFQRRNIDGHQVHEKMLNITNQRNANQTFKETSLHTCYNSYYQEIRHNK